MGSEPKPHWSILITGASGVLGAPLCERLRAEGLDPVTLGRSAAARGRSIVADLSQPATLDIDGHFDVLFHLAPLWLLPPNLESLARSGVGRVIAFSSTSVETKKYSRHDPDRELAASLCDAEESSWRLARKLGLRLTVLRPTMIYGFGRDKNITAIANMIRRLGFFPIAGAGRGCRQPVHALDLVEAAFNCMEGAKTAGKTYSLGGGERLSYRQMVDRIFSGLGRTRRSLQLPVPLYKALISGALKCGAVHGVSPAAAERMNQDLCFDNTPAQNDFGYVGSRFLQDPARDLPAAGSPPLPLQSAKGLE